MIAVTCACSFETKVPDQFFGQVVRCPKCHQTVAVGTPTPVPVPSIQTPAPSPIEAVTPHVQQIYPASAASEAVIVKEAPAVRENCEQCRREISSRDKNCGYCGWDKKDRQRKCVKCAMPIVHDDGPGFSSYGIVLGIGSLILFRLIGIVGILALAAFLGSLSGIGSVMKMRWRCGGCDREPDPALLSTQEKEYHRKRWTAFLFGTIGLGVLFLALVGLWFFLASYFAD